MKVTFLAHSGFLVELEHLLLLFDWWTGALPRLPEGKPLLVLVSHQHHDHFDPHVFTLARPDRETRFLLGDDITLSPENFALWSVPQGMEDRIASLGGGHRAEPFPGVSVEALPSTDSGVAFLVTAEQRTIYHAGDLNWWHWEGEPDPWNPDMERRYKAYTKPLAGRHIDLAMVPLDSRLGPGAEHLGLSHLLEIARVDRVLPMHQWGDYTATQRFLEAFPQWAKHLLPIQGEGEVFQLP